MQQISAPPLLVDKDDVEERKDKELVKSELVIEESPEKPNDDGRTPNIIETDDLDNHDLPTLVAKSSSLEPDSKFSHMHPRMIYEVLKFVQQNGSINSSQLVEILEPFDDMNSKAEVSKCQ